MILALFANTIISYINNFGNNYLEKYRKIIYSSELQYKEWDGRFSSVVRERAAGFDFPDMRTQAVKKALTQSDAAYADRSRAYITDVHPCIVNDIFKELMKIEKQKNMEEENGLNMELDEDIGQEM